MNKTELVIFDCDGTLVNSELLHNNVLAGMLAEYELCQYDTQYCLDNFSGKSLSDILRGLEAKHAMQFRADILSQLAGRVSARMEQDLQIVEGALATVKALAGKCKVCVASNAERTNVLTAVRVSGIGAIIPEEHVFSASQVARGKPAPDLFLYAAERMGVRPEACLVIEDSVTGAKAGVAAGMRVIGFTGVHHAPEPQKHALTAIGVEAVVETFPAIAEFLAA